MNLVCGLAEACLELFIPFFLSIERKKVPNFCYFSEGIEEIGKGSITLLSRYIS